MRNTLLLATLLAVALPVARAADIDSLLGDYRNAGASGFSAARGKALWMKSRDTDGEQRACSSCHQSDPATTGKHVQTGKTIEPMAPSVNPERFSSRAKVEKWFRRNCKWTLGRECTSQEKGDVLTWLDGQQEKPL